MSAAEQDEDAAHPAPGEPRPVPDLRAAMRAARVAEAERSEVVAELRGAELARLDMLHQALEPVLAQVPAEIENFDVGIMPGLRPRLFVDMIAFVEMGHDRRLYRFVQDTRQGRLILAESERMEPIVEAVTAYIARRLVDREKALAGVCEVEAAPSRSAFPQPRPRPAPPEEPPAARPSPPSRQPGWLAATFGLLLDYLGIGALLVVLFLLGRAAYLAWVSPSF